MRVAIAFLLGAATLPFGLWIRSSLPETLHLTEDGPAVGSERTGLQMVRDSTRIIVLALMVLAAGTISTYVFNYMTTFAQHTLHMAPAVAFAASALGNVGSIAGTLFGGWLSDRIGRRPVMIVPAVINLILLIPIFLWITETRTGLALSVGTVTIGVIGAIGVGAFYASVTESLPKRIRGGAFATVYALSIAIFGGTTQLIITWLIHATGSPMAPAWYLFCAASVGLDFRGEARSDQAVAADQIFVEIPPWRIERPLAVHPFVERMGIGTADLGLCGDREAGAVLVLRSLGDLGGVAGLLAAEIVGGDADDQEAAGPVARPQLLQPGILRGVAALGGSVDDEDRLAGMFGQLDVAAGEAGEMERECGDPAHRRGLRPSGVRGGAGRRARQQGEEHATISEHRRLQVVRPEQVVPIGLDRSPHDVDKWWPDLPTFGNQMPAPSHLRLHYSPNAAPHPLVRLRRPG